MRKITKENQIFFYALLVALCYLTYQIFEPLFALITVSLIIAMFSQPLYRWILDKTKRSYIATPLTMTSVLIIITIPLIFLSGMVVNQVSLFINEISQFSGIEIDIPDQIQQLQDPEITQNESEIVSDIDAQIQEALNQFNEFINRIPFVETEITIDEVRTFAAEIGIALAQLLGNFAIGVAYTAPGILTNLVLFFILLAVLIPSLRDLKKYLIRLSPLDNDIDNLYIKKVQAMSISMVRGTFVIAVVTGLVGGLLLWIAQVPYVGFWTLLTIVLAIFPFGEAIVQWPLAIAVLLSGNIFGFVVIAVGNIFVISNLNNILRPKLVSKEAHLNPALTILSFIGGLQVFGALGFIYGPVILILLITTFEIYISHYKEGKHT